MTSSSYSPVTNVCALAEVDVVFSVAMLIVACPMMIVVAVVVRIIVGLF